LAWIGDSASAEAISASSQVYKWSERARRQVRRKVATVLAAQEVLGQLSLEVVGEASAVLGDKARGLSVDPALMRALDGRKNAAKNAAVGARRRAPRHRPGRAAQAQVKVSV